MKCKDCKWLDMNAKTSVGYLCTNTRRKMNKTFQRRGELFDLIVPTSRLKAPTQPACKTGFEPKGETRMEKTCENCKHESKDATEFPCSCCIHNATDKFEPKPITADGVEVVRCKDCCISHICKYRLEDNFKDDDFCSYGKKEGLYRE